MNFVFFLYWLLVASSHERLYRLVRLLVVLAFDQEFPPPPQLFCPGIRGLYAGTVPSLVANVAENAVLFLAYGAAQNLVSQIVKKQQKELNTFENACAGSLASIASGMC